MTPAFYEELVAENFYRVCNSCWPVKSMVAFSHNLFDFGDPSIDQRKNLESVVRSAEEQAKVFGRNLVVTTLELARKRIQEP